MAAKRKPKGPEEMPATNTELRPVRLALPPKIHALLRMEAAKRDVSLASLAQTIVADYLTGKLIKKDGGQ